MFIFVWSMPQRHSMQSSVCTYEHRKHYGIVFQNFHLVTIMYTLIRTLLSGAAWGSLKCLFRYGNGVKQGILSSVYLLCILKSYCLNWSVHMVVISIKNTWEFWRMQIIMCKYNRT